MAVTTDDKIKDTDTGYQNITRIDGETLTGTVSQNKAEFDKYPNLIKDKFNNLIDDLVVELGGLSNGKVDKVENKGLSTNDFSNSYKTKLDGVASGAEVNVQADWNETNSSSDAYIKNKPNMPSTLTASNGIKIESNVIKHTNSAITAQSSQALYPVKIDSYGHITAYGSAVTSLPASDVYSWAKSSTKPSYTAGEVGAVPTSRTVNGHALTGNVAVTTGDLGIADYVVEQGTSGIWTYRKWNSGKSECWGAATTNSAPTTQDAGGYRTSAVSESFPSGLFTVGPVITCSVQSGDMVLMAVCIGNASSTSTGSWAGFRLTSNANTGPKYFCFDVKGRWK